jgi:mannose/cellobiose epimerase-like protein (N-acyl-D-glucosamine 2-epimerase family)
MYLSPEAERLLDEVRHAHEGVISHFNADEAHRRGFRAVYEALESACGDLDDAQLQAPIDGGWSAARVLVHLAEHDQRLEEAAQRGIEHMIEHGLEHARGLWVARLPAASGTA